jgi:ubiquinone/menaquinone biosynthesis C-methylase UbiE
MNTDPHTPSGLADVRDLYEASADGYAKMMDAEIDLPVYADTLERLCARIADVSGPIVDAACGSGHMLARIRDRYDPSREVIGLDLSPRMVAITAERLGTAGRAIVGDMTALTVIPDSSAAALVNFFALHHLDPQGVRSALGEWRRVLTTGGQLVVAAWEGDGVIDYGEHSDVVALRYRMEALRGWCEQAGFEITRCLVEPVEDFPMDAIYLEGTASARPITAK